MAKRLRIADWVGAGLTALARSGAGALKADLLARALGVSRGSFYWHFADLAAFHAAVIARWSESATLAIIVEVERTANGQARLHALLRRAFTADPALEIGIRAWAASDPRARRAIELVDRRRVAYLERLLRAGGVGSRSARLRAELIYWAYLGFALSRRRPKQVLLERVLGELAALANLRPHGPL
jgi:AcrR family transcriptional regulator